MYALSAGIVRRDAKVDVANAASVNPRVHIRRIEARDKREILALNQTSIGLHSPWITTPLTSHSFRSYYRRTQRDDHEGVLCCLEETGQIVGVFNLNGIIRGSFQSSTIGYYASVNHTGHGYMTEGLNLVLSYAFKNLGLHRVEANIQPNNDPSRKLVQRCGFVLEGFSPRFLFIDGRWRDHERWVAMDDREALHRQPKMKP